jgi:hypothetical protein
MIRMFIAEEGKVWKSKKEGWIGSDTLILGSNDDVSNYEQVDKPIEETDDGRQQTEN